MKREEISRALKESWQEYSYNLAMESENGRYSIVDVLEAFSLGSDTVLLALGMIDRIGGAYVDNNILKNDDAGTDK